jgi:signal transduction histidine kinase
MQDNLVLYSNDSQDIHNHLFSLLEKANNLEDFCQYCYQLLSEYVKLDGFVIVNNYVNDSENMKVIYSNNLDKDEEYLSQINQMTKFQDNCLNTHLFFNFKDKNNLNNLYYYEWFKENNINFFYIIPLDFKNQKLGHLFLDIEKFNYPENPSHEIVKLLGKFLSLYLYHNSLEIKELGLKIEEKKLLKSKENQSKYLSHMNHELRTPIAAVIGFAKMLQQQLYGELNPKQSQYVDAIYQSGKYLLDLVSDLLDISKIEAKKEDLYIEKILVTELCESSLALIKTKAEEQGIKLKLKIDNDIQYCYLDQRRIKQVLVNLLSNAIKFTENGSIILDVKQKNNNLQFNIIDTGIGIKAEYQEKLFQPFTQLNTHLHRQHRGTGLGLVISRELARLHGGDITLISEENKGSCFTLTLPFKI